MNPPNAIRHWWLSVATLGLIFTLYAPSVTRSFHDGTSWSVSDLHINYAAGFVRRGLLGEVAYWARDVLGISTGTLFPTLFLILTAIQAALLAALASPLRARPALFIMVMLAPALILFAAYDYGGYLRKEAVITIGLFAHAILVRQVLSAKMAPARYNAILFATISPYLALSTIIHENQVVFLPAHALLIYMAHGYPRPFAPLARHVMHVQSPALLPAVACFGAALLYQGDASSAAAICASWRARAVTACDAMGALGWSYDQVWYYVMQVVTAPVPMGIFIATFVLALIPPLIVWRVSAREDHPSLSLLLAAMLPTVGLFFLGWDWGRWIHMISVALIALLLAGCRRLPEPEPSPRFARFALVAAALIYVATWRVNVCCLPTSLSGGLFQTAGTILATP